LHRGLVSLPTQHHDFGAIGDGTGCSTASQRYLGLLVRYQVLVEGSHRSIGSLCSLCNCLPACAGQENQPCKCQSDDPDVILPHPILPNRAFRAGEHRPRSDSQIVNRTKWAASSRNRTIHDSIMLIGQNQTAWHISTVESRPSYLATVHGVQGFVHLDEHL